MADLLIAEHFTLHGVTVNTVLRGERYVTEARCQDTLLNRAENTDRFWAGAAHMAILMAWQEATRSSLAQAVIEAREEGHGS